MTGNELTNVSLLDQFRENPPYNAFDKEVVLRFGELEEYLPPTTANTIVGTDNNDELKETQNQISLVGKRATRRHSHWFQ